MIKYFSCGSMFCVLEVKLHTENVTPQPPLESYSSCMSFLWQPSFLAWILLRVRLSQNHHLHHYYTVCHSYHCHSRQLYHTLSSFVSSYLSSYSYISDHIYPHRSSLIDHLRHIKSTIFIIISGYHCLCHHLYYHRRHSRCSHFYESQPGG